MKIIRDDLSDKLVHFTKPSSSDHEINVFQNILSSEQIIAGNGMIKGGHRCICFSEAPVSKLGHFFANPNATVQYKPFGVMFSKRYIYGLGGRPVIYQEDAEYTNLPQHKRHLHVRFEMTDKYTIDHTWEREWRLLLPALQIDPAEATLVVPHRDFVEVYREIFVQAEIDKAKADPSYVKRDFPWHFLVLDDLGVPVPDGA